MDRSVYVGVCTDFLLSQVNEKISCNFQAILCPLQSCEDDEFSLTVRDAKFIYTM